MNLKNLAKLGLLVAGILLTTASASAEEWDIFKKRPHPYTDIDDMIKYFDRGLDFTQEVRDAEFESLFKDDDDKPFYMGKLGRRHYIDQIKEKISPSLSERRPVQKGSPARNQEILKAIKDAGAVYWFENSYGNSECREMTPVEKSDYLARARQENESLRASGRGNQGLLSLRKPAKYQSVAIDVGVNAYQTLTQLLAPRLQEQASPNLKIVCLSRHRIGSFNSQKLLERIVVYDGLFEYECVFEQSLLDPVSRKLTHGQTPKNPFWKMACLTKQGDLGGY